MKKIKRIYRWIIISVLLQLIALSYINFVYLPNRGVIKSTMYESAEDSIKSKSMRVPSDVDKISVSFNGLFAAYIKGNNLIITDILKKRTVKSISASGGEFTYFRWLPDRDMLIYSVKSPGGKKGQALISTYDIGPGLDRSYPKITGLPEGSTVVDIELSALTNVVYTAIKTGESRIKIYKYNIMDNLSFIMNTGISTVLKETAYADNLVYQGDDGRIRLRSGKGGRSSSISFKSKVILLAVDSEDNIYAGELNKEKKVTGIRCGKLDQQVKMWKLIKPDAPALPSDLFVTPDGSVYRAARKESCVYTASGSYPYTGVLLDMLDDYIVSRDGNWLKLTALNK